MVDKEQVRKSIQERKNWKVGARLPNSSNENWLRAARKTKMEKRWTAARYIELYGTRSAKHHGQPESKSPATFAGTSESTGS